MPPIQSSECVSRSIAQLAAKSMGDAAAKIVDREDALV